MPESNQVAIYYLVGRSLDGNSDMVYIGQTEDLRSRLKKHAKDKEFWEKALVLVSRANSLTNTHSLFIESYSAPHLYFPAISFSCQKLLFYICPQALNKRAFRLIIRVWIFGRKMLWQENISKPAAISRRSTF